MKDEQKIKALELFFMDDYEYDKQHTSQMTEEEYERFLIACPEFLKESAWAQEYEKIRKKKAQKKPGNPT